MSPRRCPVPLGGTVYQQWRLKPRQGRRASRLECSLASPAKRSTSANWARAPTSRRFCSTRACPRPTSVPTGPYGVYHSTFDDYAWFVMNADPQFVYLQEMARVFGLEALRMADADVLPYDYVAYAREIQSYIDAAKRKARDAGTELAGFGAGASCRKPVHRRGRSKVQPSQAKPPQATRPGSTRPCARPKPHLLSPKPACPTGPGTSTPSTPPASIPATRPS